MIKAELESEKQLEPEEIGRLPERTGRARVIGEDRPNGRFAVVISYWHDSLRRREVLLADASEDEVTELITQIENAYQQAGQTLLVEW